MSGYCASCCVDPDVPEKKGPRVFAKQIGAFTDDEEPVSDSVLAVQDQWYRPPADKKLPEPDERLRAQIGTLSLTFENAEGYSVILDPEGHIKSDVPDPGPRPVDADRLSALIARLQRANQEAARRRVSIRIPTLTAGCCFAMAAIALLVIGQIRPDDSALLVFMYLAGFALCAALANVLLLLSVIPADRWIQRWLRLLFGCIALPSGIFITHLGTSAGLHARTLACTYNDVIVPCWAASAIAVADVAAGLIVVCFACCILIDQLCSPGIDSMRLLKRLYAATGFSWVAIGVFSFAAKHSVLIPAGSAGELHVHVIGVIVGIVLALLGGVVAHPRFRRRMQIWFAQCRLGSTVGSGLHELLGGRAADEVILEGQSSFRAVPADRVYPEHFLMPTTQPEQRELYALSEPAQFGFVDAFISYSWSEDTSSLFIALQQWREAFKKACQREPLLWIDRYCLHPSEVEAAAMMPTYIAGCQKFLSLAGSRYLKSLRCLVEVFVFGELGRMPEELYEMLLLADAESRGQMHEWIDSLNVWNVRDTSTALLRAREAASGRHGFETKIKRILYVGLDRARVHRGPSAGS